MIQRPYLRRLYLLIQTYRYLFLGILSLSVSCNRRDADDSVTPPASGNQAPRLLENLLTDPSFEDITAPNKLGQVFPQWDGWRYEGDAEFRVSRIAHGGKTSCLLVGAGEPKIRIFKYQKSLPPGRYQVTAYIRGLNIGEGKWRQTIEFAFGEKYFQLGKNGTFGWTKLYYVGQILENDIVIVPSFGLMAPGRFWIDDVDVKRVDDSVQLTDTPVIGQEESQFGCSQFFGNFDRCPICQAKNAENSELCCACGELLHADAPPEKEKERLINSFEEMPLLEVLNIFNGVSKEKDHITNGESSVKIMKGSTIVLDEAQDWSGYENLLIDSFVLGRLPVDIFVDIRDDKSVDYWTRVNYITSLPPGEHIVRIPLSSLYVGEKSRPGRKLDLKSIRKMVVGVLNPNSGVYLDNVRISSDIRATEYHFDGLLAFDLGEEEGPVMPGFIGISKDDRYNKIVGYGFQNERIWRSFNALQPDPLYQDFICIESGGFAIDLPNGFYQIFVNMDNPSGYWGEYQVYDERQLIVEGEVVRTDRMDLSSFKSKYYRNWQTEDTPSDNTFDKYQKPYFKEHLIEAKVEDGQLNIDFKGQGWACSVSAIVVYPSDKTAQGLRFLQFIEKERKEYFENEFRRILHEPTGDAVQPDAAQIRTGFIPFVRHYMKDVFYNDRPFKNETESPVMFVDAFAGEIEPVTVSVYALRDMHLTGSMNDLIGPQTIPSKAISVGVVSNRLVRKTTDGRVFSIEPKLIIPSSEATVVRNSARSFWLSIHVPTNATAGDYKGEFTISSFGGESVTLPVQLKVHKGVLAEADLPIGPWGHTIDLPWLPSDPGTIEWNREMAEKSLRKLREYGFTTFTGMPSLKYIGFKDGAPVIDFEKGDEQMRNARSAGFYMPIVSYVPIEGLNLYYQDLGAMKEAGFDDYSLFIKAVFQAIEQHAQGNNWLPVYWNIGDEPLGEDVNRSIENASAYMRAFPKGPPLFTIATSFFSDKTDDLQFALAKSVHMANLDKHTKQSVSMLRKARKDWGYYNDARRFSFGVYLFKAVNEYDLKMRLGWHWNVVLGDPYYPLDCREDDFAWANSSPDGDLVTSVFFEREMHEGLDDYRYLRTLSILAETKNDHDAQRLVDDYMSRFTIGDTNEDFDFTKFRREVAATIDKLGGWSPARREP